MPAIPCCFLPLRERKRAAAFQSGRTMLRDVSWQPPRRAAIVVRFAFPSIVFVGRMKGKRHPVRDGVCFRRRCPSTGLRPADSRELALSLSKGRLSPHEHFIPHVQLLRVAAPDSHAVEGTVDEEEGYEEEH